MSSRRKRRAVERKLAKEGKRNQITVWTIVIVALVVIIIGLARVLR